MAALGVSIRAPTRNSSRMVGKPYLGITSCLPFNRPQSWIGPCRISGKHYATLQELPAHQHTAAANAEKTYTGPLIMTLREALGFSLVAQAIDGVEVSGHVCRIIAEEQAHADGDHETNGHPQIRQRCGNRRDESPHQCGYAGAD